MGQHPEFVPWLARMEQLVGGRFIKNEPPYAVVAEKARRQLPLVVDLDPAEDASIPCGCTDRRRSRCTCNARWRRGRGHALSCAMVLGRAA